MVKEILPLDFCSQKIVFRFIILNETVPPNLNVILKSHVNYVTPPFPHFAADNIFPESVLREIIQNEFPDHPTPSNAGANKDIKKDCPRGGLCFNSANQENKIQFSGMQSYGPATVALFTFLKSPVMMHFLEKMSGIYGLIADDMHAGSGLHQTLPGGLLGLHSDFNKHKVTGLHRRVNMFVYLNPDWKESYGGYLELWPKDLSVCQANLLPTLGRFAMFSSTDYSYHGHPKALACPPDRSRRSLALYYYTKTRPAEDCINNECDVERHTTNFVDGKCDCGTANCGESLNLLPVFDVKKGLGGGLA
jgi:hypothetical protein